MLKLVYKDIVLTMHPTAPMFLALSAMLLIPAYPLYVAFFYTGLAIFFTCQNGREQQDIAYAMLLPVTKRDIVGARFLFAVLLELLQLIIAVPFALLRNALSIGANPVGMDANAALFGLVLVQYALFNAVFFGVYYRNVRRVGAAFLRSCIAMFLYIGVAEAAAHAVPFVRDVLDTPAPAHMGAKLAVLCIGMLVFIAVTLLAYRRAVNAFERQDL